MKENFLLEITETRKKAEVEFEQFEQKYRKSKELEGKVLMLMDLAGISLKETEQARLDSILKFFLDHHPN